MPNWVKIWHERRDLWSDFQPAATAHSPRRFTTVSIGISRVNQLTEKREFQGFPVHTHLTDQGQVRQERTNP